MNINEQEMSYYLDCVESEPLTGLRSLLEDKLGSKTDLEEQGVERWRREIDVEFFASFYDALESRIAINRNQRDC